MRIIRPCFVLIFCILLVTGCGSENYDHNTLIINNDYSINALYVTDFDPERYDIDLFRQEAEESVESYNEDSPKAIDFKECGLNGKNAYARLIYRSCEDYSSFNNIDLYSGNLAEALENGKVDQNISVSSMETNTVTTLGELADNKKYALILVSENAEIRRKGELLYKSANVSVDDEGRIFTDVTDTGEACLVFSK